MRLFLIKLAAFLAPLVAIWLFLEWKIGPVPILTEKRELILTKGERARIVVLGSSHELIGIAPGQFDCEGLNLAGLAQSLFYDSEIMRVYAQSFPALRLVIQGISYPSFEGQLGDSPMSFCTYGYSSVYGTRLDSATPLWNVKRFSRVALLGQEAVIARILGGFRADPKLRPQIDEFGWLPRAEVNAPSLDGSGLVGLFNQHMKPEHIAENVQALEDMVTSLRERGARVVLVSAPMAEALYTQFDPVRVARMQAIINDFKARYGIEYFDFTADPRFTQDDFHDVDHLSKEGAEKFSRILNDEVIRPLHVCPPAATAP
jgi:hypothetical protein